MQKDLGWMAGSILEKLRGLCAKNWALLEIFLNRRGLRVESGKTQGLFRKIARPKGYLQI